jgi:predicted Zn-dependent protease
MVATLAGRVRAESGDTSGALALYGDAIKRYPRYRGLSNAYARLLLDAKRPQDALRVLNEQLGWIRSDPRVWRMLAEGYARLGQKLQQHRAQAEAYLLMGSLPAAIEQLQLGLRAGDGDYYQSSSAEARLRELRSIEAESRKRK